MIFKNKLLIIALLVGAALRLWSLGANPPHLFSDEAALGYNAYSILNTGRDEHGDLLPIIFKSFGDWKPGLYVYLTVPFVSAFGLTEWSVRLPSALAGITAIYLVYLITRELFQEKMANVVSFVLAITPWHIHFSRGAWEANVALTILLGGIYFFLNFVSGSKNSLLISSVLFALTLWAYQGAKLSTLIVLLLLCGIYRKTLLKYKKNTLSAALCGFLIAIPVFLSLINGKAGRLEVFSVFSYRRPQEYIENILTQASEKKNSLQYFLYHSEQQSLGRGVLGRWLNHYSGKFLFFDGDENLRHHSTDIGMLLLVQAPFLAIGFLYLLRQKNIKAILLTIGWLILAPLPAALSRDSSHAIRSFHLVIPLVVICSAGTLYLIEEVRNRKKNLRNFIYALCTMFFVINFIYYLDQYYIHYPKRESKAWTYGYKQAVGKLQSQGEKSIVFQQSYNQPYIFFLFYTKYDPRKFQQIAKKSFVKEGIDVGKQTMLENITFKDATLGDLNNKNKIIVYDPETPPFPAIITSNDNLEKTEIKRLDNSTAFIILKHK
mgnify:CR=1 FL=1